MLLCRLLLYSVLVMMLMMSGDRLSFVIVGSWDRFVMVVVNSVMNSMLFNWLCIDGVVWLRWGVGVVDMEVL